MTQRREIEYRLSSSVVGRGSVRTDQWSGNSSANTRVTKDRGRVSSVVHLAAPRLRCCAHRGSSPETHDSGAKTISPARGSEGTCRIHTRPYTPLNAGAITVRQWCRAVSARRNGPGAGENLHGIFFFAVASTVIPGQKERVRRYTCRVVIPTPRRNENAPEFRHSALAIHRYFYCATVGRPRFGGTVVTDRRRPVIARYLSPEEKCNAATGRLVEWEARESGNRALGYWCSVPGAMPARAYTKSSVHTDGREGDGGE